MKYTWLILTSCVVLVLAELLPKTLAGPYLDDDDGFPPSEDDYSENAIDRLLQPAQNTECGKVSFTCEKCQHRSFNGLLELRYRVVRAAAVSCGKRLLSTLVRRGCVRRGGNCDHRPNDCCYNSSCRCNLWGANCRCQRMGLFQKWG